MWIQNSKFVGTSNWNRTKKWLTLKSWWMLLKFNETNFHFCFSLVCVIKVYDYYWLDCLVYLISKMRSQFFLATMTNTNKQIQKRSILWNKLKKWKSSWTPQMFGKLHFLFWFMNFYWHRYQIPDKKWWKNGMIRPGVNVKTGSKIDVCKLNVIIPWSSI